MTRETAARERVRLVRAPLHNSRAGSRLSHDASCSGSRHRHSGARGAGRSWCEMLGLSAAAALAASSPSSSSQLSPNSPESDSVGASGVPSQRGANSGDGGAACAAAIARSGPPPAACPSPTPAHAAQTTQSDGRTGGALQATSSAVGGVGFSDFRDCHVITNNRANSAAPAHATPAAVACSRRSVVAAASHERWMHRSAVLPGSYRASAARAQHMAASCVCMKAK